MKCHDVVALGRTLTGALYCASRCLLLPQRSTRFTIGELCRCPFCATEFEAIVVVEADDQCTLVITAWKDLGSGRTHEDEPFTTRDPLRCKEEDKETSDIIAE